MGGTVVQAEPCGRPVAGLEDGFLGEGSRSMVEGRGPWCGFWPRVRVLPAGITPLSELPTATMIAAAPGERIPQGLASRGARWVLFTAPCRAEVGVYPLRLGGRVVTVGSRRFCTGGPGCGR